MKQDKTELLKKYDEEQKREKNLDIKLLLVVYLLVLVGFVVFLPKIYIRNQIYYTSRDINKLYNEYSTLKEENNHIKQELESLRFKNLVQDDLEW